MGPIQDSSQPGDDFSEKLLKLNASKESPSLSTRIYNAVRKPFHACYELWCGHEKQKWKVHVSAEHMSKQEFYGNSSKIALQSTIAHLKRINTLLGGKGVEWAKKLEYALKTRKSLLNNLIPTSFIAKKVREDVRSLKIGDSLIVPLLLRGQTPDSRVAVHDTVMEIKRTGTSSFSVILHNTGGRVGSRHERVCTEKDRIKYQTAYIYEEVPQENLCDDTFFLNLFNQSRERGKETEIPLYNLLTNLRGTPVSTIYRNQREYWGHAQIGGSCTASSLLSLLSSHMGKEKLKIFKNSVRKETFLRMYKEALAGRSSSSEINVAAEIAKKLLSKPKTAEEKAALEKALYRLERAKGDTTKKTSQREDLVGFPPRTPSDTKALFPKDINEDLSNEGQPTFSFTLSLMLGDLKKGGVYTRARHERLLQMFHSIEDKDLTEEEQIQFKKIALKMAEFIHTDPALTKDQAQICAAIMVLIFQKYKGVFGECPPQLSTAAEKMARSYIKMNKEGGTATDIDKMIIVASQDLLPTKIREEPLSSPLHEALELWKAPDQRERAIQGFLKTSYLSAADIYLFFKMTEGTPEASAAKNHLEDYFRTRANTNCPPEWKESYDRIYSDYLLIAEQRGLTWYEAMIFASSCAEKYLKLETDSFITTVGKARGTSLAVEQKRAELMNGFLQEYSSAFLERLLAARTDYHPDIGAISERLSDTARSSLLQKIGKLH